MDQQTAIILGDLYAKHQKALAELDAWKQKAQELAEQLKATKGEDE